MAQPLPEWSPSTPDVGGSAIDELIRQHEVVAIHFWASWNSTDRSMDQHIRAVSSQFTGRVVFASCNIDLEENNGWCQRIRLATIPTLCVFVGGKPRRLIVGAGDPERLARELEMRLRDPEPRPWWAFWRDKYA